MGTAVKCIAAAFGMWMMILDSTTAFQGAQQGIQLCIQTVIPSLFPFLLLSTILVACISGYRLRFLDPICKVCRIPKDASALFLLGILGGYPSGAICVSQAFENGRISKDTAKRMMPICNQCGPAFLFGIVAAMFHSAWMTWCLWIITILSALITLWILPGTQERSVAIVSAPPLTLTKALDKSIHTMASICGWVILFRVMIAFLHRWVLWWAPMEVRTAITGMLELSNGCIDASQLTSSQTRFLMCVGMTVLGGACVTMQTFSVTTSRLDRSLYIPGKLLQCLISVLLAWIAGWSLFDEWTIGPQVPGICLLGVLFLSRMIHRKNSSISQTIRV